MTFIPITRNLSLYQGSEFSNTFYLGYTNTDFSNTSIVGKLTENHESNTTYSFTGIGFANACVTLSMNGASTALIPEGRFFYDIFSVDASNNHNRIMNGIVTVYPSVTFP